MFRHSTPPQKPRTRLGAAAVELAVVMPLFMTITFGSIEIGHALNVSQKLESIIRDGGRLASKDATANLLAGGITHNQKVINDITNMIKAEGIPTSHVNVTIVHADGPSLGQPFDLSLASNQYKMMKLRVTIPYSDVSIFPLHISSSALLDATLVTSRGRSTISN